VEFKHAGCVRRGRYLSCRCAPSRGSLARSTACRKASSLPALPVSSIVNSWTRRVDAGRGVSADPVSGFESAVVRPSRSAETHLRSSTPATPELGNAEFLLQAVDRAAILETVRTAAQVSAAANASAVFEFHRHRSEAGARIDQRTINEDLLRQGRRPLADQGQEGRGSWVTVARPTRIRST